MLASFSKNLQKQWSLKFAQFKPLNQQQSTSLTQKTLLNMAIWVTGVVLVSAGVSYIHMVSRLENQTQKQLEKYINVRGQQESATFQLAQNNLTLLRDRILQDLQQPVNPDFQTEFKQQYFNWSDGTRRNFPDNRPLKEFDSIRRAGGYVGRNVVMTEELQNRLLIVDKLVSAYGAAWSNQFVDTYFTGPENIGVNYWHGVPVALQSPADLYHPKEEYFYIADPQHDPSRTAQWTGVYLDPNSKLWMVSAIAPVYQGDRFLGTVGHDVTLTDLIEHTIQDQLPGTYNLIFRSDGRLIVHPHYSSELQKAQGQLKIDEVKDPNLNHIFQLVTHAQPNDSVLENTQDNEYLAVTRLTGPDWYFVTVYPKSLLAEAAWSTAQFILIAGAVALLVELLLLMSVLRKQIAKPLQELTVASNQLANGDFAIHLDTTRQDELGQLANSFNSMANHLQGSFAKLEQINDELEQRVEERTTTLQATVQELHRTQTQMIQSEKMSALGHLVAGVAHEINNPVNFIHGNLTHVSAYAEDLMSLIQAYQGYIPHPPQSIQTKIEEIDLDFLMQDTVKLLQSMKVGTNRIREIVLSLRNFSRLDEAGFKPVDVHEGINSTLLILQNRLKVQPQRPAIQVIKDYGQLPIVNCYPGRLNQVFMNIFVNAIDALDEEWDIERDRSSSHTILSETMEAKKTPIITVRTAMVANHWVEIAIADNGGGIPESIQKQIFDPFFTTKSVGKGTGMGMSISYQIIVEHHHGEFSCTSVPGEGAEFTIRIPIKQNEHLAGG